MFYTLQNMNALKYLQSIITVSLITSRNSAIDLYSKKSEETEFTYFSRKEEIIAIILCRPHSKGDNLLGVTVTINSAKYSFLYRVKVFCKYFCYLMTDPIFRLNRLNKIGEK
jgi:hypothetical protein